MSELFIKKLRKTPAAICCFLFFLLAVLVVRSYSSIDKPFSFYVRVGKNLPEKAYHRMEIGANSFVTGTEGRLSWKPQTFTEAFILQNVVDNEFPFSLFDIVYLFILTCILYWMFHDIEAENLFNRKVLKSLRMFSFMIAVYMAKGIIQVYVSNYFLNEITQGQFHARLVSFSLIPYFVAVLFFQLLPTFILKAQKIQKEQELTI